MTSSFFHLSIETQGGKAVHHHDSLFIVGEMSGFRIILMSKQANFLVCIEKQEEMLYSMIKLKIN